MTNTLLEVTSFVPRPHKGEKVTMVDKQFHSLCMVVWLMCRHSVMNMCVTVVP